MTNAETSARHVLAFVPERWQVLWDVVGRDWSVETAIFVLAEAVPTPGGAWRLLASDVIVPPDAVYQERTADRITLDPEFMADVLRRARHEARAVFWVHSHPHGPLAPSQRDIDGETLLLPRLRYHVPQVPHGRLIISPDGLHARLFLPNSSEADVDVQRVGARLEFLNAPDLGPPEEAHARQVLAFGETGQRFVRHTRFAVIGAGGTGSLVVQQLAHLGAQHVRVYDMDTLEETNRNRVVGARADRVGDLKVNVAADLARAINPDTAVYPRAEDITEAAVARTLLDADFFFCCTDSHGSRAVLSQLAYQYLLPGVDLGVVVRSMPDGRARIAGRVQMLAPGLPCLLCSDALDPEQVRVDLMTPAQRQADPYVVGDHVAQPAVISLNSSVAGAAVTMMLAAVAGISASARYQVLRLDAGLTNTPTLEAQPTCPHCSPLGALGRGDRWTPPGRTE